ncbi:MAG: LD-carboxypeptidase [Candidatus Neomarinimicrobiota bacterium]
MLFQRRNFLKSLGALALLPLAPLLGKSATKQPRHLLAPRLRPGQVVGLINPAGVTYQPDDIAIAEETLAALGLGAKRGKHLLDRYGYLAGTDQDRAADVNAMFADPEIDAVMAVRGGWGCNRILPYLDYSAISRHPKIIIGYSDITSLLVAINARTGLVTFHGPVGISTWNPFTVEQFRQILFDGAQVLMRNPEETNNLGVITRDRVQTITGGKARGRLVGGNLSVLAAMVGSDYLPDWDDKVLFLEEVGEDIYRVDRMLTQLKLAGILDRIQGFIFGKCTKCDPGESYGSLTLDEVLADHVKPLGIPAWQGAMIGHIEDKFTVPVGVEVEIDADSGTLQMLEAAVS